MHCEAFDGSWKCWEEVAVNCKFRGKYLEVCPLGIIHVYFPGSENHYTFPKVRGGWARGGVPLFCLSGRQKK